jgi:hypothetical protein
MGVFVNSSRSRLLPDMADEKTREIATDSNELAA